MDQRDKIRKRLHEKLDDDNLDGAKKQTVIRGKIAKCLNKLYSAMKYLDSCIENCEDQETRKKLEKIKNVLGQHASVGYGFAETYPTTIINKLENMRRDEIDI